jgi:hypothetical protein
MSTKSKRRNAKIIGANEDRPNKQKPSLRDGREHFESIPNLSKQESINKTVSEKADGKTATQAPDTDLREVQ